MTTMSDGARRIFTKLILAYLEVRGSAAVRRPDELFEPRFLASGQAAATLERCGEWDATARRTGYPDIREGLNEVITSQLKAVVVDFPESVQRAFRRRLGDDPS